LVWKCHGKYFLKGIDAPTEIYEILDSRSRQPRSPLHARKKRSSPPIYLSAGFLLIGIAMTIAFFLLTNSTEVWFVDWYPDKIKVDQKFELTLDGKALPGPRKSLLKIEPGKHLLQFDAHWQKKYYMEIEVKRGKNYIKPQFVENFLPSLSRRLEYSKENKSLQAEEVFLYLLYEPGNRRADHKAKIVLALKAAEDKQTKDQLNITYDWQVVLDGQTISQGQLKMRNQRSNPEAQSKIKVLYEDKFHYYYLKYYIQGNAAEAEIGAAYIEYKE
jgi:hypothetical protein